MLASVYLLLPALPWHLIMLTECMKVGQRFTPYSTSLLERISTSLLTGKATPWRLLEREEERDVSEQPDVPGCDSPTHHWLPD